MNLISLHAGDTFIFLLAGHEVSKSTGGASRPPRRSLIISQTSAHTLAFAFALLALHPEEQDLLYEEITSVMKDGKLPVRSKWIVREPI